MQDQADLKNANKANYQIEYENQADDNKLSTIPMIKNPKFIKENSTNVRANFIQIKI